MARVTTLLNRILTLALFFFSWTRVAVARLIPWYQPAPESPSVKVFALSDADWMELRAGRDVAYQDKGGSKDAEGQQDRAKGGEGAKEQPRSSDDKKDPSKNGDANKDQAKKAECEKAGSKSDESKGPSPSGDKKKDAPKPAECEQGPGGGDGDMGGGGG